MSEKKYTVTLTITVMDGESAEEAEEIIMDALSEADLQVDRIDVDEV